MIDSDGHQAGIMSAREALALAQSRGLDLVEVAPAAQPPVCRVMDFDKYRYTQKKESPWDQEKLGRFECQRGQDGGADG